MNREYHRWIVQQKIITKCAMRFCDKKGRSLKKETRGSHVPYSMEISPIDGKRADEIRSPDDIAGVTVYRVRPVPMVTEFRTVAPVVDEPHSNNNMLETKGARMVDMYEYYLKRALDNKILDVIEIS